MPVLTWMGETFAQRVAPSLLNAVGLNELVRTSVADYEGRGRSRAGAGRASAASPCVST